MIAWWEICEWHLKENKKPFWCHNCKKVLFLEDGICPDCKEGLEPIGIPAGLNDEEKDKTR